MTQEYDSNSEREYNTPEAPRIVEPEPMIHKIPKWVKNPILYCILGAYLSLNFGSFIMASEYRSKGMSKSKIEGRIDRGYSPIRVDWKKGRLENFVIDDLLKPGRELAYLIKGDGEQEK